MKNFFNGALNNELIFVYGLIALVVVLIIVIIIIDKRESKKRNQNLFDTLNMKIIADSDTIKNESNDMLNDITNTPEVVEINSKKEIEEFESLQPIKEVEVIKHEVIDEIANDEFYAETDLEKTQAQIRIEEITKALQEAEVEEKIEKDKYELFEEEQEKNAIISYNELKESFEKIYSENEKIQYLEDDEIPINIDELYKKQNQEQENNQKVELKDFSDMKQPSTVDTSSSFKSSPYISPVYGIQEPPVEIKNEDDIEIESANQFLQTLKELKNNLD